MLRYTQAILQVSLLSCMLLCVTSCVKYYEVVKTEFPQGTAKKSPNLVAQYLKSVSIYDQFKTRALFDVLWLSEVVRTEYVHRYAERRGKDAQAHAELLNRQLEENKHWISCYLLADIRDRFNPRLNEKEALWSVYLRFTNGETIEPVSIKEVELESEYQNFFGSRFNPFKTVYLVKFPATNREGEAYPCSPGDFVFVVAAPDREALVTWSPLHTAENKKQDEDFYWG